MQHQLVEIAECSQSWEGTTDSLNDKRTAWYSAEIEASYLHEGGNACYIENECFDFVPALKVSLYLW